MFQCDEGIVFVVNFGSDYGFWFWVFVIGVVFEVVFVVGGVEQGIEYWICCGDLFQVIVIVEKQCIGSGVLNSEGMFIKSKDFVEVIIVIGIVIGCSYYEVFEEVFVFKDICVWEGSWVKDIFIIFYLSFFRVIVIVMGIVFIYRNQVVLAVYGEVVDCIGLVYIFYWLVGEEDIIGMVRGIESDVICGLVFEVEWEDI